MAVQENARPTSSEKGACLSLPLALSWFIDGPTRAARRGDKKNDAVETESSGRVHVI
jgi:hypothetical protein